MKNCDSFAELVNDRISRFIAEADVDIIFLCAVHIEHLCLLAYNVLFLEKFFPFSLLEKRETDTLHSIYTIIAKLLAVIVEYF